MTPIQEIHLVCVFVARVLSSDFDISYAFELAIGVSLLVKRTLGVELMLVHVKVGEDIGRS